MRPLLRVCLLLGISISVAAQKKTRLPEPINLWDYEEYAPSVSADGKTLIFQSDRYGVLVSGAKKVPEIDSEGHKNRTLNREATSFFGIYETRLHPSGQWSRPEPVDAINRYSAGMTPVMGGPSISYDGNYLYFFANFPDDKSAYGKEDLYYSVREKYGWSKPINLGPEVNTPGYEGFPSISSDGRHLYFVREDLTKKALGEERCYRIMRSEKDAGGNWKRPIELPSPVNMDCEKAPRIMADNKTLVFSSIKKKNKGGFDLYISRLGEDGHWSEPKALDFVNSKYADQSVAISACGDEMYYISNGDIYTISIPEELRPEKMMTIQGFVADAENQNPVSTRVALRDVKTDKIIASVETNPTDGRYTLLAPQGGLYEVEVDHRNYRTARKKADLQNINHCEIIRSDFQLEKSGDRARRSDIIIEEVAAKPSPAASKQAVKTDSARAELTSTGSGVETEVIAGRRSAPKVVNIVEEERAHLTEGKQVVTDSLKEAEKVARKVNIPEKKVIHTITLLVRDGENNSVIKDVKLSADGVKYEFDAERNAFEVKVSESDNYRIVVSAPGYQPEEYRIQDVNASKRVVVQLYPELPSNLTVMVTDIHTGDALSSTIDIKSAVAGYSMENPSGKSVIEFNQAQQIELTIQAPGYTTLKKVLNIEVAPEGRVYQLDARLEKVSYTLRASAIDKETRQALTTAEFYISSPDHANLETAARPAGEYVIPGFGKYRVKSLVSGYQDQFLELEVDKNITEVVFEMVKKAKANKEIALLIRDEYTKEPLVATVKTSARLLQQNPPVIQLEEGAAAEAEIQVNAYPSQKIQLDYRTSSDQVEVSLKKELYPFRFRVISEVNRRGLTEARINILEDKTRARFEVHDGVAEALLAPGKEYSILVSAEGHSGSQLKFQPLQALYDNLRERIIALKPVATATATEENSIRIETKEFGVIEKGRSVQLNNIYFDQSSPVLKPESHTELDHLARVLGDNTTIRIEVRGYTDNQGDFNKNIQLSKDRCQAVIDYLVSKGIAAGRMAPVGRGPLDPVAPNNSEENRSKNRRVEFVVL